MTRVTSQALNNSYEKERRKRCGFRWLWKTVRGDADATWRGRSFQVRAVARVDMRVRRTDSEVVDADRRRVLIPSPVGWLSSSARYVGAWIRLYVRTASLN